MNPKLRVSARWGPAVLAAFLVAGLAALAIPVARPDVRPPIVTEVRVDLRTQEDGLGARLLLLVEAGRGEPREAEASIDRNLVEGAEGAHGATVGAAADRHLPGEPRAWPRWGRVAQAGQSAASAVLDAVGCAALQWIEQRVRL